MSETKLIRATRFDAECGKIGVTLFTPQPKPILIGFDSTSESVLIHLSIADAEQLRDTLIDIVREANENEQEGL